MSKRVWEVCEPHPDVFARDIDPSMFAASLDAVERGTADPDYTDPERFFAKTFMTRSLENVLEGVLARLLGQPGRGAPLLRLETPFGGGKTHTMVALYHLVKSPEAAEATEVGQRLAERLNVRQLPRNVRVAVLDGVALDVRGRRADGLTVQTLWGELAWRLGGRTFYEAVRDADEARVPPGQPALAELLRRAQPVLILMDEVLHYLALARAVKVGDSNLMEQTASFLRALTAAVVETPEAVLVVSLPASSLEVSMEDREQAERMFQHLRKVLGRAELIETPVAQDEVFGVLKRRLFQSVGSDKQARQSVEAFSGYYSEFARFFPERLRSPQYRERMREAYPFHPELVDLLYQRWGPHPQFQRTRGALRLLALVLRRLWNQRPGSAYLIQPHHIDLADRHIRAEVVRLLDGAFDAIATGDVLTRAREIDRELGGDYYREELAKGAANCAFLYSVSAGAEFVGATEEELRVALLRPPINPAQVSEVLGRLRSNLWFLRYRDQRYFFTAKPNLNKVILDHEQQVSEERVEEALLERLKAISGSGKSSLHVVVASLPEESVPDPTQATLVLLPLSLGDPEQAQAWMKRVVERTTRRNLLVFLAPERGSEGRLRAAAKRLLALKDVQKAAVFRELDPEDKKEVDDQVKEQETKVKEWLFAAYNRLYRPSPEGIRELRVMLKRDATLAEAAETALKERGELIESLSPEYLLNAMDTRERPISVAEIETVLSGAPGQPVVTKPKEAIARAVREGVEKGVFAVEVEGKRFQGESIPDDILSNPGAKVVPVEPVERPGPEPKTGPVRVHLTLELPARNAYPLRKLLEHLQSTDAHIKVQVSDDRGSLARKRRELEDLLKDYGIAYDWKEGGEE
ncbi:MAG: hypothetical protein C4316_10430 [Chloroflexota bacterium]